MISPQMDQAQDPVQIPQMIGPPALDGIDPTFGFQSPPPPEVRLAQMKADAKAKVQETNRRKDSVALPAIQEDLAKGTLHQQQLEASIAETQKLIQSIAMPQYQQGQLSMGDNIGAALSGIFGGAQGFNQAAGGAYERADQMAGQRYKEAGMQYQQDMQGAEERLKAQRMQWQAQEQKLQMLNGKIIDGLMSEDAATRAEALEMQKAAISMSELLAKQKGDLELEDKKQKGRIDVQKIQAAKTIFKDVPASARGDLAKQMGLADDPNTIKAIEELTIEEQEKQQRTKNLAQLYDYNTKANPQRIKVMEAQEKALLSMVPLREAQTQHTLEDIERVRAIVGEINTRTSLLDDKFKLDADEFLFRKSQAELKGAKDLVAIDGAIGVYEEQVKTIKSQIAQKRATIAAELAKDPKGTPAYFDAMDELKVLTERQAWAEKEVTKLRAEKAKQPPDQRSQAAFSGARSGGGLSGKIDKSGKLPAKKSNPYAPVQVSPDMGNTGSVGTAKRKEGKNPFEDLGGKVKG